MYLGGNMKNKIIRVAIVGYGNLGKGVESIINNTMDMELICIITRRNPSEIKVQSSVPVINEKDMEKWKDKIDIAILCGGSAKDLLIQGPQYARLFNTVDAFDIHQKALEYIAVMDNITKESNKIAVACVGWDPGLFSTMRFLIKAILPASKAYTFWGYGVSQGHSDAIRNIEGVKNAMQYTVPIEGALQNIRDGKTPNFTKREMHKRICFVSVNEWADKNKIEQEIKNMPYYFDEYETIVNFMDDEELIKNHSALSHGGTVIGVDNTNGIKQVMEFKLNLNSNPLFTAAILIAYTRATYKMHQEGIRGCKTFADVAPKYLTNSGYDEIITQFL